MSSTRRIIAVYRIVNLVSRKFYIGSSGNLYERWRCHRTKLRAGTHPNAHLQASWNKHGEDVFKFERIAEFECLAAMEAHEQELLHARFEDPLCMNIARYVRTPMRGRCATLHPNYGRPMSEEQRAKLRRATQRQWQRSDPRTGKTHSGEVRAKISARVQQAVAEGRGGRFIPTAETRSKMSEALKGNQCAKGYRRTAQEKAAIAERMRGNTLWLGRKHTAESRAKMSKPVRETTSGQVFPSLSAALAAYGMKMPTLRRALVRGTPITQGRFKGLQFVYV